MSRYFAVEGIRFTDQSAVLAACRALGFSPEAVPEGRALVDWLGHTDQGRVAHLIIPREQVGSASNDIGFQRQADGSYALIISEFDSRVTRTCPLSGRQLRVQVMLQQQYQLQVVSNALAIQGYRLDQSSVAKVKGGTAVALRRL